MSSIITITLSPCIDKSTTVNSIVPDKKLRCTEPKLEPGGGGINVARVITRLGGNATAIFPAGGYAGKYLVDLVKKENVPVLAFESVHDSRENLMVLDEEKNEQYRFIMPGHALEESEWNRCLKAVESVKDVAYIVVSGSMPAGMPADMFSQLSKIATRMKAKLIVDTSGKALLDAIQEDVYLIKPNLAELASLGGMKWVELADVELIAKKIIRNNKCRIIVVSLGKEGAMLVTEDEKHKVTAPEVTRKSTVGAGDSMVAGIIFSLSIGRNLVQALQYGVACGTAATINPGTELCRKEDADRLYAQIAGSY